MLDQYFSQPYWQLEFFHNTFQSYAIALGILIILLIVFKIFQSIFLYRLQKLAKKTKTDIDDILIKIVRNVKPPFYFFLSFWLAIKWLEITVLTQKIVDVILIIWITGLVIKSVQILIDHVVNKKLTSDKQSRSMIQLLSGISKIILWFFGLLMILSNLGVNITSLIAGLGIGGIAVALALQNILSDLFSSFAIYLDKPFIVGDFITVDKDSGTVEKIGIKTTRLISMQGEQLIISNKELTSARINNFQQITERRVAFELGVEYNTNLIKTKQIPDIIAGVIKKTRDARLDRVHFKIFGDSAMIYEIVYYVKGQEYAKYMDVQQEINFKIKEEFEKAKIAMAFPTQTIHLEK
ncbi:MAG: mechanosensitive ion channel family protein [bacterium]